MSPATSPAGRPDPDAAERARAHRTLRLNQGMVAVASFAVVVVVLAALLGWYENPTDAVLPAAIFAVVALVGARRLRSRR